MTNAETYEAVKGADICATITVQDYTDRKCKKSNDSGHYRIFFDWDVPRYGFTLNEVTAVGSGYLDYRITSTELIEFYSEYVLRNIRLIPEYLPHEPPDISYEYAMPGIPMAVTSGNSWVHFALLGARTIQPFSPHSQPYLHETWEADTTFTDLAVGDEAILHAVGVDLSIRRYGFDGSEVDRWDFSENAPAGFAPDRLLMTIDEVGSVIVTGLKTQWLCRLSHSGEQTEWFPLQGTQIVGLAADATGRLYVLGEAEGAYEVTVLDSQFHVADTWGIARDNSVESVVTLGGVAAVPSGDLLISDAANHRVLRFSPTGEFLTRWGMEGSAFGQLTGPGAIATERNTDFHVFVCDRENQRVQEFYFPPRVW